MHAGWLLMLLGLFGCGDDEAPRAEPEPVPEREPQPHRPSVALLLADDGVVRALDVALEGSEASPWFAAAEGATRIAAVSLDGQRGLLEANGAFYLVERGGETHRLDGTDPRFVPGSSTVVFERVVGPRRLASRGGVARTVNVWEDGEERSIGEGDVVALTPSGRALTVSERIPRSLVTLAIDEDVPEEPPPPGVPVPSPRGASAFLLLSPVPDECQLQLGQTAVDVRGATCGGGGIAWSNDGARIAVVTDGDGGAEVGLFARGGEASASFALGPAPASPEPPRLAWSPDDAHLFVTDPAGRLIRFALADAERRELGRGRLVGIDPTGRFLLVTGEDSCALRVDDLDAVRSLGPTVDARWVLSPTAAD